MALTRLTGRPKKAAYACLQAKQGMICCYCDVGLIQFDSTNVPRKDVPKNSMTLEHLKRLEDGGTNDLENLALACFDCNVRRGGIDWFTYKCYKQGELWTA